MSSFSLLVLHSSAFQVKDNVVNSDCILEQMKNLTKTKGKIRRSTIGKSLAGKKTGMQPSRSASFLCTATPSVPHKLVRLA